MLHLDVGPCASYRPLFTGTIQDGSLCFGVFITAILLYNSILILYELARGPTDKKHFSSTLPLCTSTCSVQFSNNQYQKYCQFQLTLNTMRFVVERGASVLSLITTKSWYSIWLEESLPWALTNPYSFNAPTQNSMMFKVSRYQQYEMVSCVIHTCNHLCYNYTINRCRIYSQWWPGNVQLQFVCELVYTMDRIQKANSDSEYSCRH